MFNKRRKDALRNVKYKEVPFFNFKGFNTWAKCVKLYDGDTCTLAFYFKGKIYKHSVRLDHIDTAEIKSDDSKEVEIANLARDRLGELIGDKLVYIECLENDKYGRILCNIYDDKRMLKSYNDILLEENLAGFYDGGKKQHYSKWYVEKNNK